MSARRRHLLYLEDDAVLRDLVALTLRMLGSWHVDARGDPRDALARKSTPRPDLLLCDLGLPGMDGLTFWQSWRADPDEPFLPAIFFTGHGPAPAARCRELGALDIIHKPFDPIKLPARIQAACEKHLTYRKRPRA